MLVLLEIQKLTTQQQRTQIYHLFSQSMDMVKIKKNYINIQFQILNN